MSALQRLAILYLVVVLLAAAWAVSVDAALLHSEKEHLVPDLVLVFLTLPSSFSMTPLYNTWPAFFDLPFTQDFWFVVCGIFQAAVIFFFGRPPKRVAEA